MRTHLSVARAAARPALVLVCLLALAVAAAACGSGDRAQHADSAQPTMTAPAATATVVPASDSDNETTGSSVLPLLLGDALGGGSAPDSLGEGDPALKQYLLQPSELPAGYTVLETRTQQVHDGISSSGTADLATLVAVSGERGSGDAQLLMSMAMHFSDLQALDKAFSQIDSDALVAQLGGSGLPSSIFKDVQTLPTDGLGDHTSGFSLTMDFSQLLGALGSGSATPAALPGGVPSQVQMQVYVFARGSYAGAVLALRYGATSPSVDLLPLAKLADARLATAP